jgi:hypothetical protein
MYTCHIEVLIAMQAVVMSTCRSIASISLALLRGIAEPRLHFGSINTERKVTLLADLLD